MAKQAAGAIGATARPPAAGPVAGANVITSEFAGKLLMITPTRVRQLAREGWIVQIARNQFRLIDVVQGYIKFLRDDARRSTISQAEAKIKEARATEIQVRTAERLRELIATDDAVGAVETFAGTVLAEFSGMPARCSRDKAVRRAIENEIYEMRLRIAAKLGQLAAELKSGGESVETVGAPEGRAEGNGSDERREIRC
jgi:hypothetical protein